MRQERGAWNKALLPVLSKPVELSAIGTERTYDQQNARFGADARGDAIDACSVMFKFCKRCDEKYLQPCNIQCLFDVDSGFMHRGALSVVCEVVEILLADIAQSGICHSRAASLTVSLKRQQGVWILALTEQRIAALRQTATVHRLSLLRSRAQLLGAACRVQETADGFITALMFDCTAVATGWLNNPAPSAIH